MQKFQKAVAAATLFGAVAAHAATSTYVFTGVMLDGYGFDGQTVSGELDVDTSYYTHTDGDGATWAQGYGDNSAGPGMFHAKLTLSGGFSMTLGGPTVQYPTAETYVYKNDAGMDQFIVDGGTEIDSSSVGFLQLRTTDHAGDPSLMFPGASASDLSFDQRVRFNTGESTDIGYFYDAVIDGALQSGQFMLTSVTGTGVTTAVPEPSSLGLLLAGLAATCATGLRRRAKA